MENRFGRKRQGIGGKPTLEKKKTEEEEEEEEVGRGVVENHGVQENSRNVIQKPPKIHSKSTIWSKMPFWATQMTPPTTKVRPQIDVFLRSHAPKLSQASSRPLPKAKVVKKNSKFVAIYYTL